MESQYNLKSPAVKRLLKEALELRDPTEQYYAQPLEENLFEWHFTIRGPAESAFEGGIYHGRIILPPDYPMKPPAIMLLTPNGRFELHTKICLSISGHHPESWQPSWSIRTALLAIIGFMPTPGNGAIGALDYTAEERQILAKRSLTYKCDLCGHTQGTLLPLTAASNAAMKEAKELAQQIHIEGEKPKEPHQSPAQPATGSERNNDNDISSAGHHASPDRLASGNSLSSDDRPPDQTGLRRRTSARPSVAAQATSVEADRRLEASCARHCITGLMIILIVAIVGLVALRVASTVMRN